MKRAQLAVLAIVTACGPASSPPPATPETPPPTPVAPAPETPPPAAAEQPETPEAEAPDGLGAVRPLPVDKQAFEHVDPEAEKLDQAGDKVGCGKTYAERFNADPNAPNGDQLLFNAAVCFEAASSLGVALQMRKIMLQRFPQSRFAPDALLANAAVYARIAFFDEAADAYEQFARKYGKRAEAPRALATAVRYRLGTGHPEKAVKAAALFARLYGRTMPVEAASAHLVAAGAFRLPAERKKLIQHLRDYLRRFGKKGGPVAAIEAEARLGVALWQSACAGREIERGLCATRKRRKLGPVYCSANPPVELTIKPRDPRAAKAAQQHFRRVLKLWQQLPPDQRSVDAAYWAAAAQFYLAEAELERYFEVKVATPAGNGTLQEQSRALAQAVKAFLDRAVKLGTGAVEDYSAVMKLGDGALFWGIAAHARIAESRLWFETQLMSIPIPPALVKQGDEVRDVYCNTLEDQLKGPRSRAQQTLQACVNLASAAGVHDKWARWCDRELSKLLLTRDPIDEPYLAPDQIPVPRSMSRKAAEQAIKADPKAVAPRLALAAYKLVDFRNEADRNKARRIGADLRMQLSSVLAVDPDNEQALAAFAAYYLLRARDNDAARQLAWLLLEEARQRNAKSAVVANARGVALALRDRVGAAEGAFREAVARDGTLVAARLNAGSVALTMRKPDDALTHFDAVLKLSPDHYDALIGRAVALRLKDDLAAAEAALRQAYKLAPKRPEAPYSLGLLFTRKLPTGKPQLQYKEAVAWLDRALAAKPPAELAAEIQARKAEALSIIKFLDEADAMKKKP